MNDKEPEPERSTRAPCEASELDVDVEWWADAERQPRCRAELLRYLEGSDRFFAEIARRKGFLDRLFGYRTDY
jgi:hypothetical protein